MGAFYRLNQRDRQPHYRPIHSGLSTLAGASALWVYLPLGQISDVTVNDASSDPSQFTFLLRNDGTRSAFVGPVRIKRDYEDQSDSAGHKEGVRILDPEQSIVPPHGSIVLHLDDALQDHSQAQTDRCTVTLELWDYGATAARLLTFERPCFVAPVGASWSTPENWNRRPQVSK
ncbi:MAG: hypothetical protein ACRBB0_25060 [Pelagimonas sp.]|uniref:hypothetical protein n=1 Tax=Pelagimonas sp. TaxID=2073170 RepID=UPI003D6B7298